ncbi:MAG: orotidine 5'-phosphate decarboxylase / HUMPS family protein [Candidatus Njordarchaeales archaeon]
MGKIIQRERSIIPACDVPLELYKEIVKETYDVEGIGGYKVGFFLGLNYGLPRIVEITREYTDKPIIYDHQKAGTDIPDIGKKFMDICKGAGIDAVILFPQSGPETEKAWIESALEKNLGVIVGGLMTHPKYIRSEGGYLVDEAIIEIYLNAADLGVTDFVVPGNRPDDIRKIREALEEKGIYPIFYAPGFVVQGGEISEAAKVAGNNWHAIIGRGIYNEKNKRQAALKLTSKL